MRKILFPLLALLFLIVGCATELPTFPEPTVSKSVSIAGLPPKADSVRGGVKVMLTGFTITLGRNGQAVCIEDATGEEVAMSYCNEQ